MDYYAIVQKYEEEIERLRTERERLLHEIQSSSEKSAIRARIIEIEKRIREIDANKEKWANQKVKNHEKSVEKYDKAYSDRVAGAKLKDLDYEILQLKKQSQKILDDLGPIEAVRDLGYTALQEKIRKLEGESADIYSDPEGYANKVRAQEQLEKDRKHGKHVGQSSKEETPEEKELRVEERMRLRKFEEVKRIYKKTKGHGFEKFLYKIQGKAPNWRKIKNYSEEELQYLLDTVLGKTYIAKREREWTDKSIPFDRSNAAKVFEERRKMYKKDEWNSFVALLRDKTALERNIKFEERKRNGYY